MKTKIEEGSGSGFEDLGFDDPEEMERRAAILRLINYYLDQTGLSSKEIANLISWDEKELEEMRCGKTLSETTMRHFAETLTQAVRVWGHYCGEGNHE